MAKHRYTVELVVVAEENEFNDWKTRMLQSSPVKDLKVLLKENVSRVKYPAGGARNMTLIEIEFTGASGKKVSKDHVEQVVDYWNSIGYIQGVKSVDWKDGKATINFDASRSNSHDLDARQILEKLLEFLENGTVQRTSFPYGRAVTGLGGNTVAQIVGR